MPPPTSRRRVTALVAAVALVGTMAGLARGVDVTEAAWTDQAHARGRVAAGTWAVAGDAGAEAVATTANLTAVLVPATATLSLSDSAADEQDRGPDAEALLRADANVVSGLLGVDVGAAVAATTAAYTPTLVAAESSAQDVVVGLNLLGVLGGLELPSVLAVHGEMLASARCPAPGTPSGSAPGLADLSVSLLGVPTRLVVTPTGDAATGAVADVRLGAASVSADVRLEPRVTSTGTGVDAALTARVSLTVRALTLLGLPGLVVAEVALDVVLVRARCDVTVP